MSLGDRRMKNLVWLTALALSAGAVAPAAGQTVKEIDARQKAVVEAWEKTPLTMRRAIFVQQKAPMFGAYRERKSNVFKADEQIITYAEPVGYSWKPVEDGFRFGVNIDFLVKSTDGKVLGGQENFLKFDQINHAQVQELNLNMALTLTGISPGTYVVIYTVHDVNNDQVASFSQNFEIAK